MATAARQRCARAGASRKIVGSEAVSERPSGGSGSRRADCRITSPAVYNGCGPRWIALCSIAS